MDLMDPKFAPLNWQIGFLDAGLGAVADAQIARYQSWGEQVISKQIALTLPEGLTYLEPLTGPGSAELWVETRAPWAAIFHNWAQGGGLTAHLTRLCEQLGRTGVAVSAQPDIPERKVGGEWVGTYGAQEFALFKPEAPVPCKFERHLLVYNDSGKWRFAATGKIQPFEKPEYYRALGIRKRLTIELIRDYCVALGIRAFDSDFYGPKAVLIKRSGFKMRTFESLAEVQRKLGMLEPVPEG